MKIVKKILLYFLHQLYKIKGAVSTVCELVLLRIIYRVRIMNSEYTIKYILKHRCSIARYGDGEFNIMLNESGIGFQDKSLNLAQRLTATLGIKDDSLLLCVPWSFNHLRYRNKQSKNYWIQWGTENGRQKRIVKCLWKCTGRNYVFGDAQITRPYIAMASPNRASKIFPMLKELWNERELLIVEGDQTRMGVGNDLFEKAKSISRILAPAKNAFSSYDRIYEAILRYVKPGYLVVLALGPTATVLAADLSKAGIQALDLGHIDVEYEWYLRKASTRTALPGKYTNEVPGGNKVEGVVDTTYLEQIVERVAP